MRIRVQFSKTGAAKYIGHLDVMRYFQKAVRRAGLPAVYSGGFHPHMRMSFAAPLGVGVTSRSEYFDLDMEEGPTSREMVARLNAQMSGDFSVLSVVRVPEEKGSKAMSQVAAAAYLLRIRGGGTEMLSAAIEPFLSRSSVTITKKTKTGERSVDIRPHIYELEAREDCLYALLAADSANFVKPEAAVRALAEHAGVSISKEDLMIERLDVYANIGKGQKKFIPLSGLGESIG